MASSRPPSEEIDRVYRRLIAGEPDGPSDLIVLLLEPFIAELRRAYPNFPDPDLISDVVTDSLLRFVQDPQRYQEARRSLWGYLKMDMQGDLLNLWRSLQRRSAQEVTLDAVALTLPSRNSDVEEAVVRKLTALPDGVDTATIITQLRAAIPDDRDWQVVVLMIEGERATATFASVLGITDRPLAEQRQRVKQAKDRLRLRLKRRGVKIHER